MVCVGQVRTDEVLNMRSVPTTLLSISSDKPRHALDKLGQLVGNDAGARSTWRKRARISAIVGSCPRSLASLDSGTLCSGLL